MTKVKCLEVSALSVLVAGLVGAPACSGKSGQTHGAAVSVPTAGQGGSATAEPTGGVSGSSAGAVGAAGNVTSGGTSGGGTAASGGVAAAGAPAAGGAGGIAGAGGAGAVGPRPYHALQIATGSDHACALLEDHRVKCWGENAVGQLGLGDTKARGLEAADMGDALPFVDLGTGHTAKQVAAGDRMSCAVLDDDGVKCWGLAVFAAPEATPASIGDAAGEMGDALPALELGAGHHALAVATGHFAACAEREDQSFWCGSRSAAPAAVAAQAGAKLLSLSGSSYVLALYDDNAARIVNPTSPMPLALESNVRLAAGSVHYFCFVFADDTAKCTGGQAFDVPVTLPDAKALAVTEDGVLCALNAEGGVRCWGNLPPDQPWGDADADGAVGIPLPRRATQISSAAANYHCALLSDASVECWSWGVAPLAAVGSSKTGTAQLAPVDLGMWTGAAAPKP